MKPYLLILLPLFILACSRQEPVSPLFRWEKISPQVDSLTVALEWAFIEAESADSISRLVRKLHSLASNGIPEAKASAFFWEGRLMNREHNREKSLELLGKAIAISDSAGYPYSHTRISYLFSIVKGVGSGKMYGNLKKYEEFYQSTNDPFMTATVSLDLGHIMREVDDMKRCVAYYMKADSIYESLGIETYHLKTSLNNATILFETDNKALGDTIISKLLKNPKAMSDRDFYIEVLLQAYNIKSDVAYLSEAWDKINERDVNLRSYREVAVELGVHYLSTGDFEKANRFLHLATEKLTSRSPLHLRAKVNRLTGDYYRKIGENDSALESYHQFIELQDSINDDRLGVEISNNESRREIVRSEAQIESRHQIERLWTWIFVMAIVLVALLVAFTLVRKIQASRLSIARYHLDLERERRSLVSSALVMEEKDNVLESVLADIHKMEQSGKLKSEETRHLEQNVKMHLSGRQDWDHFRELFDNVHPLFHKRLKETYPELTEGDLRLATYIKVGMQGKQIARMLMLQPDTVRKNRQKLRRHLNLSSDESLEDLLRSIDS